MFNSVQYVRDICQKRKIPISQLEKECGFSNGYLNPKKMIKIPYERAQIISEYLGISVTDIFGGEETTKTPATAGERSQARDILDEVDVAFYGDFKELDEDQKETVRDMVRVMRERRAKKQEK